MPWQSCQVGKTMSKVMSNELTDQQLVARVQAGNKQAFNLLVSRYQHKIAKLVSRFIANHADVSDVCQETFIRAYRALPNFRNDSAFYTWLYRIAVNTSKNWLTAQKCRPPANDIEVVDAEYFEGSDSLREQATPERLLLTEELQKVVLDTIESLPDELQTAIKLRELDGFSYDEIASAMQTPVGTVRSRIFRARELIDQNIRPLLRP